MRWLDAMAVHDPEFLRRAQEARSRIVELGPAEVDQLRLRGAILIDVRSPAEFADGHLEGALSLNLQRLEEEIQDRVPDQSTPLICYCNGGNRGALAADALQNLGYRNVHSIAGGLSAIYEASSLDGHP
jgi:phage shock protein E